MKDNQKYFFIFCVILIVSALIYLLSPILTPFLIGFLLAYLSRPLIRGLRKLYIPRMVAVLIVFIMVFGVITLAILLLTPLIEKQVITLKEMLPIYLARIQDTFLPWIKTKFDIDIPMSSDALKNTLTGNWQQASDVLSNAFKIVLKSGFTVIRGAVNIILIPVVTFYLLRDWDFIFKQLNNILPPRSKTTIVPLVKECDEVLSAFFRGQLLVMLSLSCIYSFGLTLVGLQLGLLIGFIAGIASIVPYLGFILGTISASIAAYIQFGTSSSVMLVLLVFVIGQALEGVVLTPKLVGKQIGLHPVAVIFSVLSGGVLFGFFGVLLALPVAALILVTIRFFYQRYRISHR